MLELARPALTLSRAPESRRRLTLAALTLLAPLASAQRVECISIGLGGQPANGATLAPCMGSSDGRYVAFISSATNLVAAPTGASPGAYLRDCATRHMGNTSVRAHG